MTARKPKPRKPAPRKASGPTLEERVANLEKALRGLCGAHDQSVDAIKVDTDRLFDRLDALEARKDLRDKSHDEPASNASEAIGQHFRIVGEVRAPWWRRFLSFMGAP